MRKSLFLLILTAALAACSGSTPAPSPTAAGSSQPGAVPTQQLTPTGLPAGGFPLLDTALDGHIVYSNGDGNIYLIDPRPGASPRKAIGPPDNKGFLQEPAWSADGQRIAYSYLLPFDTSGLPAQDLLSANADGSSPQTLLAHTMNGEVYASPAFSPDGRFMYYSHSTPILNADKQVTGVTLVLERIDLQTKQTTQIASNGIQPAVSPDGKQITFVRINPDTFQQDLMTADADGQNLKAIVPSNATGYGINGPRWTPDGKRILFGVPNLFSRRNVEIAQAPASLAERLLSWFAGIFTVSVAEAHGPPWDLWIVDASGENLQRLTEIGEDDPTAAWSPDGKYFAFVGLAGFYIVDASGKNVHWLIRDGGRGRVDWKK